MSAERAFAAIERIGGTNGWYGYNWLWAVRGWLDRCIGGPGMSRGRCDSKRLSPGEKFDCWHVEICDRPRRLRLAAEMKLPGRGWLEFEVVPRDGDVTIHQTAVLMRFSFSKQLGYHVKQKRDAFLYFDFKILIKSSRSISTQPKLAK